MGRIPIELLRELAEGLKRGFDLPNIYLTGSQSPIHPNEPRDDSDIDLVTYPFDYQERIDHYRKVNGRFRIKSSKHPELDGRLLCIGVFDPKDHTLSRRLVKGHSIEYWRRYMVKL